MKLQKLFITSLVLGITSFAAKAGDKTVITTDSSDAKNGSLGTSVTFTGSYSGKVDLKDKDTKKAKNRKGSKNKDTIGDVSVVSAGVSISQPLPSFGDGYQPMVEIGHTSYFIDRSKAVPLPKNLSTTSLTLGLSKEFGDHWSFFGGVSPTVSNAGKGFGGDGFGVAGVLIGSYAFSETFKVSAGVAGDSLAEGSGFSGPIGPVVGIEWAFAEKWTLSLGVPNTELAYQITPKLKLALSAAGEGGTFAVKKDPLRDGKDKPDLKDSKLSYESAAVTFKAEYALTEQLTLEAQVGYVVQQEFEYTLKNEQKWAKGKKSKEYKLESDGGAPYSSVSVSYNF
jgi:hypothetical protein